MEGTTNDKATKAISPPENKGGETLKPKQTQGNTVNIKVIKFYAGIEVGELKTVPKDSDFNYMVEKGYWEEV